MKDAVYLVLALVPAWFMLYTANRVRRHWNDGVDKYIVLNNHVYFKWTLTAMMVLFCFIHSLEILLFTWVESVRSFARTGFFALLLFAWVTSFFLGVIENKKRLPVRWTGHRSFMPANIVIHVVLLIFESVVVSDGPIYEMELVIILLYCFATVFSGILTGYAVLRPNEFAIDSFNESLIRKNTKKMISTIEVLKITIESYKIKIEVPKTTVFFTIVSSLRTQNYISKKCLFEFDKLDKHIHNNFPKSSFPNMQIPELPNFTNPSLEYRKTELEKYLNSLLSPEFYTEDFLDFLGIEGLDREILLKSHREIYVPEESDAATEVRSTSILERYYAPNSDDTEYFEEKNEVLYQKYIYVKINKWIEVDKHIEYEVISSVFGMASSKFTLKRYSDFLELNKTLSKTVFPACLPKFPSKNYLKKLCKIDEKALNIRKNRLECFINHIANDPAFLSKEILDFLEIDLSTEKILSLNNIDYAIKIHSNLTYNPEIDDSGHFILYHISFSKYVEKAKKSEWTISRRYKEFDGLNEFLTKRAHSPLLQKFYDTSNTELTPIPALPPKGFTKLVSHIEIENRKQGLKKYLKSLLQIPLILYSYELRKFLQDSEDLQINS